MDKKTVTVNGVDVEVGIDYRYTGFRVVAKVYDYEKADDVYVEGFGGELRIMQTPFEAMCDLSSELFDEAVWGEVFAEKLNIPIKFYEED